MIEIRWREEMIQEVDMHISARELVDVRVIQGAEIIYAQGRHPSQTPEIQRAIARMSGFPPEEVDHYKQVLADLIQARYGIKSVEIT